MLIKYLAFLYVITDTQSYIDRIVPETSDAKRKTIPEHN